jgi:hypothetical protein
MASIRESATGKTLPLEPDHVVGRALTCALRLAPPYVSAQQTLLRWTGDRWCARDLGSSNGTFVDGVRIAAGEEYPLQRGSRVAFGDLGADWELVDDGPPQVMAIPLDGGTPLIIDDELLALPSADDPQATIYRGLTDDWLLEQHDESVMLLRHFVVFACAGRMWRFCCGQTVGRTTRASLSPIEMRLDHMELIFSVSLDEEHVGLQVRCGGRSIDMGVRAHHYLLLTLARQRIRDAQAGLPEASCGWIDREDVAHDPRMASPQLNVDVFRIRRQFADKGVVDAATLVERRPRQLRIGTGRISIERS